MKLRIHDLRLMYPTFCALRSAAVHEAHVSRPDGGKLMNEDLLWMVWSHYSNANKVHAAKVCGAKNALEDEVADKEIDLEIIGMLCKWYGDDYRNWIQNGCG